MHERRKLEHLEICLNQDVRSALTTGLERYRLVHQALPEMRLADVDTATSFLGRPLAAPLLISAMTGGTPQAREINRRLAAAAQSLGLAMGLGSQRAALEDPALWEPYQVRDIAPDIVWSANLAAGQRNNGYGPVECWRAVEAVGADALVLHLNPLQEALQSGGDTDFRDLVGKIGEGCASLSGPGIVNEGGWGLAAEAARALAEAGVAALDVGGAGGTSWSEVERYRSATDAEAEVASAFVDWGIPTADSLAAARAACPELPLIASGGVTNGVEVALCLALGADLAGMALPLLRPAMESTEAVRGRLEIVLRQLRVAMFACGARRVGELNEGRLIKV